MSHPPRDGGFTLIETMVTIALLGAMMAIAVSSWSSWSRASEQSGTAREIQSLLRQAQQRAVTEGRSMCVLFDTAANKYTLFRGRCDEPSRQHLAGPFDTGSPKVQVVSPAFTSSTSTQNSGVTFTPRGSAWPGGVRVTRTGSAKVYVLTVEGLTGRVLLA